MKSFFISICLVFIALNPIAQQNWTSNFNVYAGIGLGIGKYDKSLSAYNNLRKINHSIPFVGLEYQNKSLPFSLDYDFTVSNYVRKTDHSKSASQYFIHKIGLGFNLQENVLFKIKYLINNQFNDLTDNRSFGIHTSLGAENNLFFGNISSKKQLNINYRVMIYYERTFGDISIQDQRNLSFFNVNSPYRDVLGICLAIRPWTNIMPISEPSFILPPF
jgi:hypothetical protein